VTLRTSLPRRWFYRLTIETVQRTSDTETNMLRNIALASVILASIAAVAPASAHGSHGGGGGGGGFHNSGFRGGFHDGGHFYHRGRFFHDGFYGYGYGGGDSCYRFVGSRRIYTCN
jgi:hypothetical protein